MSSKHLRHLKRNGAKLLFGDKCQDCGYDEHWEILEFHHVIPRETSGRPKLSVCYDWSWEKLRDEVLEHCTLLCPNCHKVRHLNEQTDNIRFGKQWVGSDKDMGGGHTGAWVGQAGGLL